MLTHLWHTQDTTNVIGEDVQTLVSVDGMEQHVNFPTHEYSGQLKSCLDLVISNINSDHIHAQAEPPLGKSDHVVIRGSITLDATRENFKRAQNVRKKSVWCWKEVDLGKLKDAVRGVTWTDVLSCRC